MDNTIRIRTTPNGEDKYLTINLKQSFDFLEILSLKLTQEEIYRKFSADYGVIVGRVIANRGYGVPNAKVSVFIPLDNNESNPEIIGRYPYKSVADQNILGIRYNLLEDTQQHNCHKAVGTFPNKRKMLDNSVWLEIYDTYYKFTTTTNQAGDYMLFGVPLGNQRIHMDVDISDIGFVSLKPYDLISQGYTINLFESQTTFKSSTDLDSLVQIQKRDTNVNVLPFWGDSSEQEIGINRVDFNLGVDITPNALFFGAIYTNQDDSGLHIGCAPRAFMGDGCLLKTGLGTVEAIRRISRDSNEVEYIEGNVIDSEGNWAYTIPMNLDNVVTDEFGNLVPSEDPNIGIPTRAEMRFRIALDEYKYGFRKRSAHYLVPNMHNRFDFDNQVDSDDLFELRWKKIYTVTNYIPRYQKYDILFDTSPFHTGIKDIESCEVRPMPFNRLNFNVNPIFSIICVIVQIVGAIFDIINELLETIIFDVVMVFVCFLKHIFDGGQQGACRCRACYDLNKQLCVFSLETANCTNCCPCASCYSPDGSARFSLIVGTVYSGGNIIDTTSCGATTGTFILPQSATNGSGFGATFSVTFAAGIITSITVAAGGSNYQDFGSDVGELLTIDVSAYCTGTLQVQNTVSTDYTSMVNGFECAGFDFALCNGLCQAGNCEIAFIPLQCNNINFFSGLAWAECTAENLAEELDVIQYDFYNDWIIGSLYSFLFDYRAVNGISGKSLENFCDFNCRDIGTDPFPNTSDPQTNNICHEASIYDKHFFVNGSILFAIPPIPLDAGQVSTIFYKGLITEQNNYLYYTARHDEPTATDDIPVNEKHKLLFATNLIELGSTATCDIDGEPFIIDRMESTSYKKDNGTQTLLKLEGCGLAISNMNYDGFRLMGQTGIEIVVAEAGNRLGNTFSGDDGQTYELVGNQEDLPDTNDTGAGQRMGGGILLFDRNDRILRKHLCEHFNYYNTVGIYSETPYPTGGDYIEYYQTNTQFSGGTTGDTVIISGYTDSCQFYDDLIAGGGLNPSIQMPPYYTYFGISKISALEKLKNKYFNPCIN